MHKRCKWHNSRILTHNYIFLHAPHQSVTIRTRPVITCTWPITICTRPVTICTGPITICYNLRSPNHSLQITKTVCLSHYMFGKRSIYSWWYAGHFRMHVRYCNNTDLARPNFVSNMDNDLYRRLLPGHNYHVDKFLCILDILVVSIVSNIFLGDSPRYCGIPLPR